MLQPLVGITVSEQNTSHDNHERQGGRVGEKVSRVCSLLSFEYFMSLVAGWTGSANIVVQLQISSKSPRGHLFRPHTSKG